MNGEMASHVLRQLCVIEDENVVAYTCVSAKVTLPEIKLEWIDENLT